MLGSLLDKIPVVSHSVNELQTTAGILARSVLFNR